jgi:hypothetical protein
MTLSQSPGNSGAPTHGISDVMTRNTHQDTPSQQLVGPTPNFGQWDVSRLGTQSNYPYTSSHWADWFEGGAMFTWPSGKAHNFIDNPDPSGLMALSQQSQQDASGGSQFPGLTWMAQFAKDWMHPHQTATGKSSLPYSNN